MKEKLELPKNALLIGALDSREAVSVLDLIQLWDLIIEYYGYVGPNFSIIPLDCGIFKYHKGMIGVRKNINKNEYLKGIRDQISDQKLLNSFDRATKKFTRQN